MIPKLDHNNSCNFVPKWITIRCGHLTYSWEHQSEGLSSINDFRKREGLRGNPPSFVININLPLFCFKITQILKLLATTMTSTLTHTISEPATAAGPSIGGHKVIVNQAEIAIGAGSSSVLPVTQSTANLVTIAAPTAEEYQDVVYEAETTIQIDDEEGFLPDDDALSSTQSVSSSVRDYVFENGRRYNSFRRGTYNMPNDDAEQVSRFLNSKTQLRY